MTDFDRSKDLTAIESVISEIITARLGPIPHTDPTPSAEYEQEYAYALGNLITDISLPDSQYSSKQDEEKWKTLSLLKGLQPHRERPSKDRSKRFAAGDISIDVNTPEHHDLHEFDYWAVLPIKRNLKVFILAQIVYIAEDDKQTRSASSKNPNILIIFIAHTYSPETSKFSICGKPGICKAKDVLLSNVDNFVKQDKDGGITLSNNPEGYVPFHNELDFQALTAPDTTSEAEHVEEESEPYLVEKIVAKRFRNNQYQYLVKWCVGMVTKTILGSYTQTYQKVYSQNMSEILLVLPQAHLNPGEKGCVNARSQHIVTILFITSEILHVMCHRPCMFTKCSFYRQ